MKKILIMAAAPFLFTSCIAMQSVSISDVKPTTGKQVEASASGLGFFALTVPKGVAERATNDLKGKQVVGNVSTVMTMRNWMIVQYYKVTATGTTEK